jgi:hypothetical protein
VVGGSKWLTVSDMERERKLDEAATVARRLAWTGIDCAPDCEGGTRCGERWQ